MKLSVVIPVMNQHPLFLAAFRQLVAATSEKDVEFVVIDNGSSSPLSRALDGSGISLKEGQSLVVVRNERSIGVYPTFDQGMRVASGDVVAFLHSDMVVWEEGWDQRVLMQFDIVPPLGLLGFIGSSEIDPNGGRGGGTTSQFMGLTLAGEHMAWKGSPASAHGKTNPGYIRAAVVDGCAMVIRRKAWDAIGFREGFPLHHFYDRLISCQMLEKGFHVGVLGIACDHISGQTVNQEPEYDRVAREWCEKNGVPKEGHNWDSAVYLEAERRFLREFRDEKRLIPVSF